MKKILSLIVVSCIAFTLSTAQTITSFSVSPTYPTTDDTIQVIIECLFTSGGCAGTANLIGVTGNEILVEALHCVGQLSVMCTDFDTIVLPPLPAGQFSFIFSLNSGQGIPCTPGIAPSDIDSVNFSVTDVTGIQNLNRGNHFEIYQSPEGDKFIVKQSFNEPADLKIFSIDGKLIDTHKLIHHENEINNSLIAGVYLIVIEYNNIRYFSKKIVVD